MTEPEDCSQADAPTNDGPAPEPGRGRLARFGVRGAVFLVGLYVAYLIAANLFLATDLGEMVNRNPEHQRVHWSGGWSWIPGRFSVSQLRFERRAPRGDLEVEVSDLSGWIDLRALLDRRLRFSGLRGRDLALDWRGRAPTAEGAPAESAIRPGPSAGKRRLAVELEDIRIDGIERLLFHAAHREPSEPASPSSETAVSSETAATPPGGASNPPRRHGFDGVRVEGDGSLAGSVLVDPERRLWLDANLDLSAGRLFDAAGHQAVVDAIDAHLAISGWHPKSERGTAALERVSGDLELTSTEADFGLLTPFLGGTHGVEVAGQGDRLEVVLRIVAGRFAPGSRLLATSSEVEVGFLEYRARGEGLVEGRVLDDGTGIEVGCSLGRYSLERTGIDRPHLLGNGFLVRADYPSATLGSATLGSEDLKGSRVRVTWPPAELPDLTVYNVFLPAERGLELLQGHGEVEADLTLSAGGGSGWIRLDGREVRVRLDDLELAGNLAMTTRFAHLDWHSGSLPIDGTTLRLDDISVTDLAGNSRRIPRDRDWWARLEVERGVLGRDLSFRGDLAAQLRDTGPLVALFQRRPLPGFVEDALRIDDVAARVTLATDRRHLLLDPFEVDGQRLEVRGRFGLAETRRGLIFLKFRGLAVAAAVDGDDFDLQVYRPRRWFERRWGE